MSTGDPQPSLAEDGITQNADGTISIRRIVPVTTASGWGVDLVCITDLDPALAVTDPESTATLAQAAFHRISTRRGTLPDDPDFGIDVLAFLHAPKTPQDLLAVGGQVSTELQKDDRFSDVLATATYAAPTQTLTLSIRITPADPDLNTFTLIMAVTEGATLLKEIQS